MNRSINSNGNGWVGLLKAHFAIARPDHIVKNVFVLPGIVLPYSAGVVTLSQGDAITRCIYGSLAICFVACSNYVINEVLDAPHDLHHPEKRFRPVPAGLASVPLAYAQWLLMMVIGLGLGLTISVPFTLTLATLWIMGIVYNVRPLRTKEVMILDVLSESVNNPLRMILGWQLVVDTVLVPPISILLAYLMVGCYFMGLKRFSELREYTGSQWIGSYRKSLSRYTERILLTTITFYGAAAMLFFGAFIARYRIELALSFPFVALVMAVYFDQAFEHGSVVQNPEHLHRNKSLMASVVMCSIVLGALLFIDLPNFSALFTPDSLLQGWK